MSEILKVRDISFEFWNAIVFFDDIYGTGFFHRLCQTIPIRQ